VPATPADTVSVNFWPFSNVWVTRP
jgi:hypothetical protein